MMEDVDVITKMKVDQNGHRLFNDEYVQVLRPFRTYEGVEMLPYVMNAFSSCSKCGTYRQTYEFGEDVVRVVEPCTWPADSVTVTTIEVPSGKMLVTDDLRPVFDWSDNIDEDAPTLNSRAGVAAYIEDAARHGWAYGMVGNSCPGFYSTGGDTYAVANPGYDPETYDDHDMPYGWDRVAGVVTDLWAYSIADFEEWTRRGGDPDSLGWSQIVVNVTPGTYEFTYLGNRDGFDRYSADGVVFATIRRLP